MRYLILVLIQVRQRNFLKILKELQDTTNMFIISHKGDILLDKFDRTIKFDKSSEFSKCINYV